VTRLWQAIDLGFAVGGTTYTYSVWIWAPPGHEGATVNVMAYNLEDFLVSSIQTVTTTEPTRHDVVLVNAPGVTETRVLVRCDVVAQHVAGKEFIAWGSQMNNGGVLVDYAPTENVPSRVARQMAWFLDTLTADSIVIIHNRSDGSQNRLSEGLDLAMYRCGASRALWHAGGETGGNFKRGGAYVLIGVPGIGEGNGRGLYAGDTDWSADAWVETVVDVTPSGVELVSVGARNALDISYADGSLVEDYKPQQPGADVTSAAIDGGIATTGAVQVLAGGKMFAGTGTWGGGPQWLLDYNNGEPRAIVGDLAGGQYMKFEKVGGVSELRVGGRVVGMDYEYGSSYTLLSMTSDRYFLATSYVIKKSFVVTRYGSIRVYYYVNGGYIAHDGGEPGLHTRDLYRCEHYVSILRGGTQVFASAVTATTYTLANVLKSHVVGGLQPFDVVNVMARRQTAPYVVGESSVSELDQGCLIGDTYMQVLNPTEPTILMS